MVSGVIKKFEIQIFGVETIIETKVETLCLPISRVFSFLWLARSRASHYHILKEHRGQTFAHARVFVRAEL